VRNDVERIVRQLRNPLQLRLRFIAQVQLKTEEGAMKQIPQSHVPVKTEENATLKQEFKQEFKTEFK